MADTPNQQHEWENQWREAFEGAEVPPAAHVWKNIESELVVRETGKYRRGFLLYRAIAAVLLLLIAGLSWYIVTQDKETSGSVSDAAVQSTPAEQPSPEAKGSEQPSESNQSDRSKKPVLSEDAPALAQQKTKHLPQEQTSTNSTTERSPSNASGRNANVPDRRLIPTVSNPNQATHPSDKAHALGQQSEETTSGRALMAKVQAFGVATLSSVQLPLVDTEQLYRVPQLPLPPDKSEEASRPSFFAGLAVAPGYFDPQLQSSVPPSATAFTLAGPSGAPGQNDEGVRSYASSVPPASSGVDDSPELSFTYGIDVGMKLFEHWVIESGIDYNRFSTSAETRWQIADVASGERYPYLVANRYQLDRSDATPAPTSTTTVNNAYEFISVPVQLGYQVAVSKLNFTLSSGVAANFFLGNSISAPASPLANVRVTADEESPFKAMYYSGVLSGGVNYSILDNYSFSLTPSYTFALTGLTRDGSTLSSQPYSFGINLGFQYQF